MLLGLVSSIHQGRNHERCQERKGRKKGKDKETNLLDETGNLFLESLHHIDESINFMFLVVVNGTLGAEGLLVSAAVGVDFLVWMLLAMVD